MSLASEPLGGRSNAEERPSGQQPSQSHDERMLSDPRRDRSATPSAATDAVPDEPEDLTLAADERVQTKGDAAGMSETME